MIDQKKILQPFFRKGFKSGESVAAWGEGDVNGGGYGLVGCSFVIYIRTVRIQDFPSSEAPIEGRQPHNCPCRGYMEGVF